MPISQWPGGNSLLSGLFGSFQSASAVRASTAQVWQTIRVTAAQWQQGVLGGPQDQPLAQLEAQGAQILSKAGVTAADVSRYRGVAGSWRTAKERLHAASPNEQITGQMIFTPPWSTTAGPDQQSSYRARILWQITPTAGDVFTKWQTVQLTSPLTTINDILAQAGAKIGEDKYLQLLSGDSEPQILDFEVEQV